MVEQVEKVTVEVEEVDEAEEMEEYNLAGTFRVSVPISPHTSFSEPRFNH